MREAKRKYYNSLSAAAENEIKTSWNIIDTETGRKNNDNEDYLPKTFFKKCQNN
jgi:hypothetical protein